jgi:hypothetical protein
MWRNPRQGHRRKLPQARTERLTDCGPTSALPGWMWGSPRVNSKKVAGVARFQLPRLQNHAITNSYRAACFFSFSICSR